MPLFGFNESLEPFFIIIGVQTYHKDETTKAWFGPDPKSSFLEDVGSNPTGNQFLNNCMIVELKF